MPQTSATFQDIPTQELPFHDAVTEARALMAAGSISKAAEKLLPVLKALQTRGDAGMTESTSVLRANVYGLLNDNREKLKKDAKTSLTMDSLKLLVEEQKLFKRKGSEIEAFAHEVAAAHLSSADKIAQGKPYKNDRSSSIEDLQMHLAIANTSLVLAFGRDSKERKDAEATNNQIRKTARENGHYR